LSFGFKVVALFVVGKNALFPTWTTKIAALENRLNGGAEFTNLFFS